MKNNKFIILLMLLSLQACQREISTADPIEKHTDLIDENGNVSFGVLNTLTSDDGNLTIYINQGLSFAPFQEDCLVVYNSGEKKYVVNEAKWRKKNGISPDGTCLLFTKYIENLYTIKLPDEQTIYIAVANIPTGSEDYQDGEIVVKAQAFIIDNNELKTTPVFYIDNVLTDILETPATPWFIWVQNIPSVWPSKYNAKTRTLSLAVIPPRPHYCCLGYENWTFDEHKNAFIPNDDFDNYKPFFQQIEFDSMVAVTTMTEMLPHHKVLIGETAFGDKPYLYASWPENAEWTDKPSVVVMVDDAYRNDSTYHFPTKDGYEYVVFMNEPGDSKNASIASLEVRKDNKVLSKETADI